MEIIEKDRQIESLWNEYKLSEESQQKIRRMVAFLIMESMKESTTEISWIHNERAEAFSKAIIEIIEHDRYIQRETEAQAQLEAAGVLGHIQDSVQAGDAFIASLKTQTA